MTKQDVWWWWDTCVLYGEDHGGLGPDVWDAL